MIKKKKNLACLLVLLRLPVPSLLSNNAPLPRNLCTVCTLARRRSSSGGGDGARGERRSTDTTTPTDTTSSASGREASLHRLARLVEKVAEAMVLTRFARAAELSHEAAALALALVRLCFFSHSNASLTFFVSQAWRRQPRVGTNFAL